MHFLTTTAVALLSLAASTYAQTFTDCNPLNETCPPDTALGISNYSINFQRSVMSDKVWNTTAGKIIYGNDGALFTVGGRRESTTVKTNFYIFFGTVEVIMKAAPGQGIVSSIVLQSDDLDEVDWEWIGGNNSYVQTNYFGKGNTTSFDRALWVPVNNPIGGFHNYTTNWTPEKIEWIVDSQVIRTLKYEEANGGHNFPQTPCDVRLGIWPGGDPENPSGTVEWAGGEVDYDKGPFTMAVGSVRVSDASTGTQYVWTDNSGSMNSIKATNQTAALKLDGNNGGSMQQTAAQRWNSMSSGAKIAVIASVCGTIVVCCIVFAFCCIRQRRLGKHERLLEDAKFEKDRAELMAFRAEMGRKRTENFAMQQGRSMSPAISMGNAGAQIMPPAHGMRGGNYAPSVSSGRGYQRY